MSEYKRYVENRASRSSIVGSFIDPSGEVKLTPRSTAIPCARWRFGQNISTGGVNPNSMGARYPNIFGGGRCFLTGSDRQRMSPRILRILASVMLVTGCLFVSPYVSLCSVGGTVISGTISFNSTWSTDFSPYWIQGTTVVAPGVTLTILEGVEVKFDGRYWFYVEGTLIAKGTAFEPITFTSNRSSPSPADWLNVMVNSTGHAYVENASFSYGNSPIIFYYSSNNSVINCSFHDNFNQISLDHANNNTLNNITVEDNPEDSAIVLRYSLNNKITNSTIRNNKYGIVIDDGSFNNTIWRNRILNHTQYGAWVYFDTQGNQINHNDFIGNARNARDVSGGGNNFWDGGYPAGGNYWDDYTGSDDFSGPNQDQPGSDGIGDTRYYLDLTGSDHYPLMNPLFEPPENKAPEISDVSALPSTQEAGSYVNVSANISDETSVVGASLEVRLPDSSTMNSSMSLHGLSIYYLNTTYPQPGVYHFNISASDSEGLWNKSSGTFTIVDTTSPLILNASASPDIQEVHSPVNISARIQDNYMVDSVSFNISCPDNMWINLTPSGNVQDLYWEHISFHALGYYQGVVLARDPSENSNSSSFTFEIQDSTAPKILSLQAVPTFQEIGGRVNITADVQDNCALESVFLNISFPSEVHTNVSMIELSLSEYYSNNAYQELGNHSAVLWATDTSGNIANQSLSFVIVDETSPIIENVSINPTLQDYGGTVNISAQITDNHILEYVTLNISIPGRSPEILALIESESDIYYLSRSYEFLGLAQFCIEAADMSGNHETYCGFFEMTDLSAPDILAAYASPDIQEAGRSLTVIADVRDNHEIGGVWANMTYPDYSWINRSMNLNESSGYFEMTAKYRKTGVYEFRVSANDTSDNWNYMLNIFEIVDTMPPEIVSIEVLPDPQEILEEVSISVSILDGGVISEVYVEVQAPESGTIENISSTTDDGTTYRSVFVPAELGQYQLIVFAFDSAGNSNSAAQAFHSHDTTPPTADGGGNRTVERGHTIFLNASLSRDNHYIAAYNWSFTDGGTVQFLEGVLVSYRFLETGEYNVTLLVKDFSGNPATDIVVIGVEDTTPPSSPQNVSIRKGKSPNSLLLMWDDNTEDDMDHYVVLRSTSLEGEYEAVSIVGKDTTSCEDGNLKPGTRYWYAIVAVDRSGNPSEMSQSVSSVVEWPHYFLLVIVLTLAVIFSIMAVLIYKRRRRRRVTEESEGEKESSGNNK